MVRVLQVVVILAGACLFSDSGNAFFLNQLRENCQPICRPGKVATVPVYCGIFFRDQIKCREDAGNEVLVTKLDIKLNKLNDKLNDDIKTVNDKLNGDIEKINVKLNGDIKTVNDTLELKADSTKVVTTLKELCTQLMVPPGKCPVLLMKRLLIRLSSNVRQKYI